MWSMALLVNTSTWYEFKHNWKLICLVFLQLYIGKDNIGKEYQDALLKKIIKIKSDINIVDVIRQTVLDQDEDTKQHLKKICMTSMMMKKMAIFQE